MKKAIDVNDRTLEMEKKDFILVCKIFHACSIVLRALCGILIAGLLALLIFAVINGKELSAALALCLDGTIFLGTIIVGMNFMSAIVKKLKDGETPFRYDIADKIKGAGFAVCTGGFLGFLTSPLTSTALNNADLGTFTVIFFVGYCGFCIVGSIILMFAYIFNYGCKLQQESDETV